MSEARPKCPNEEHVRRADEDIYCVKCGWAICFGCGKAFDLMCDDCDDDRSDS